MLDIRIEGIQGLERKLNALPTQLRGAIANGLNRTMSAIEQAELNAMEQHLDRPTPFTMNALGLFKAYPNRLQTTLFVKDIQAAYLKTPILGGNVDNTIVPVLSNARLNQYGNLPGRRPGLAGVAGRSKKRFVGKVRGKTGVWERLADRRLKPIAVVDKDAPRAKRLPFYEVATEVIQRRLNSDVLSEIEKLLR